MSNLSELLPAGAGAKSADFVASGTLGSGATVALKADGTVSVVGETPVSQALGSAQTFNAVSTSYTVTTFDSSSNKIVVIFKDNGGSGYGVAVVGTVSGTSISFGSETTFAAVNISYIAATFDSTNNKIVIAYRNGSNSNYGTAIVGTVSGTSISFGSAVVFESASSRYISCTYDSTNKKIVIVYRDVGNADAGTAIVGTVSGTSISFGSASTFTTDVSDTALAFDSNTGQIVIIFRNNANSNYGTGVVGTVSGTSISFGSLTVFESADSQYNAVAFDSSNNKAVVAYRDAGNAFYGTAVVGTISGTSISFGTPVVFESASTWYCAATYDSAAKKVAISYQDDGNAGAATLKVGTVSGTSITFNSPTLLTSEATNAISSGYDSNSEKVVISFYDAIVEAGRSRVYQPAYTATNNTDFIGITDQAIADTATGAVIVQGGVSDKLSGLTVGADYYVQADGSLAASGNTPYAIAGSTYDNINFSVNSQASSPSDVKFNADGSKMYVVSPSAVTIYEYDLTTNFDVSSSAYARSKSLSAQAVEIYAITFKPDGTKMYSLSQVSGSNYYIDQYSLSTSFDVSSASYDSVRSPFSLQATDNSPQNIIFNNDGSKIYMVGIGNDKVYEFPLSTPYVVSSMSNGGINFSVASQETSPKGIAFNPTGTQMFIVGPNSDTIFQYGLTSGFDITTASYSSISYNVNPEEADPRGFAFNSDGTKFYIIGGVFPRGVYQYSTTVASTTVPAGRALSTTSILLEG